MATSSIFANVRIKNKTACKNLISALEKSKQTKAEEVVFSRPVETIKGDKIKEIFK